MPYSSVLCSFLIDAIKRWVRPAFQCKCGFSPHGVFLVSHYLSLGFDFDSAEEFRSFLSELIPSGETYEVDEGKYVRWSPGEGIELWLLIGHGQAEPLGANPHFVGNTRFDFGLDRCVPDPRFATDGLLWGWGDFGSREGHIGGMLIVVEPPNFVWLQKRLRLETRYQLQITAFAHSLDWFANEAAYLESQSTESKSDRQ